MKILLSPVHVADQLERVKESLKMVGIRAKTMALYKTDFNYSSDYELNLENSTKYIKLFKRILFFIYSIFKFDYFHFYFGETLLPFNYDLYILKMLKKKMIMTYCGSEIRIPEKITKINKYYLNIYNENSIVNRKRMKRIKKWIKNIIVTNPELKVYAMEYYENVYIVNVLTNKFEEKKNNIIVNNKICIAHIPSNALFKGTEIIIEVLKKLKEKIDFDYIVKEKISKDEVFRILDKSNLVIDQLRHGIYGTISVEAFAKSLPSICYINEYIINDYPSELPIINATIDNLYEILFNILKEPDILKEIGERSYNYYKKYHSPEVIGKQLRDIYKKL